MPLIEAWHAMGLQVRQVYGATETHGGICLLTADHASTKVGSTGLPYYGIVVRVVDLAGEPVPPGVPGEVVTRGPHLFSGCWNQPETTRGAVRDGWFHTGDIAEVGVDGFIYIKDRSWDWLKADNPDPQAGRYEVDSKMIGLHRTIDSFHRMFHLEYQLNDGSGFDGDRSDDELALGIRWDFGSGKHRMLVGYDPLLEKVKRRWALSATRLAAASLRRDRDQRQFVGAAGIGQREKEHDGRERPLGQPVAVVHPEPLSPVLHRDIGRLGACRAAAYLPDLPLGRLGVHEGRRHDLVPQVLLRNLHVTRKRLQDLQQRAAVDGQFVGGATHRRVSQQIGRAHV